MAPRVQSDLMTSQVETHNLLSVQAPTHFCRDYWSVTSMLLSPHKVLASMGSTQYGPVSLIHTYRYHCLNKWMKINISVQHTWVLFSEEHYTPGHSRMEALNLWSDCLINICARMAPGYWPWACALWKPSKVSCNFFFIFFQRSSIVWNHFMNYLHVHSIMVFQDH